MNKNRIRLDLYLSKKGLSSSRENAKREIISGWVKVNGETVREASRLITGSEEIKVSRPGGVYASRGGEKLEKALKEFNIDLFGKTAVDLGASTGGFTDCMLRNGAEKVYAIDVGYGQFAYELRNDKRVVLKERTNVRYLKTEDFDDTIDFVTADLSFISITKVFENMKNLFPDSEGVILIKPQFEAEKGEHKKGVVRKKEIHKEILRRVLSALCNMGMFFKAITFSPVRGPAGNMEFLAYYSIAGNNCQTDLSSEVIAAEINKTVDDAHNYFA